MTGRGRKAFFEPSPHSAQRVRAFVRDACQDWELSPDAPVLMVDELATNAILHARTTFWVTARRQPGGLRVEVGDGNPREPALADVGVPSESGRGLYIVAALARRWGTEPHDGGKTVWFEV